MLGAVLGGVKTGLDAVSDADRQKWNARYELGAYQARTHANELLEGWLPELPVGRALDVACGAGRNSVFLASAGFQVDGLDISAQALARGATAAESKRVEVNWIEQDLDDGLPDTGSYELIIMFRYLNLPLIRSLAHRLVPGGYLIVEEHLVSDAQVIGPNGSRFRVEPGELAAAANGLEICFYDESVRADPDGRQVALARLVARQASLRDRSPTR
jgi:SAM-dependent methyltransferase